MSKRIKACPTCGGTNYCRVPRRDAPDLFLLRRPLKCNGCGIMFVPESGAVCRFVGFLVGAGSSIGVFWRFIFQSGQSLVAGERPVLSVIKIILGFGGTWFGIQIAMQSLGAKETEILDTPYRV